MGQAVSDFFSLPLVESLCLRISELPFYHVIVEGCLILLVIWLLRRKSYRPTDLQDLTEAEKNELIAEWEPEPLVPELSSEDCAVIDNAVYVDGKLGKHVLVGGKNCLNFATLNFLNLVGDPRIEDASIRAVEKYGVGSCGPRGFYGTVDVHLELEKRLAQFMRCEEAVLYSYGFACIASAIPAYAKRGDVIFCDKGVNFAIQKGLQASRARLEFFKHNDMEDLERLLRIQTEKDEKNPNKAKVTRRFLVVEGIYMNHGDICPLLDLLALKWKYKVRIFIDESLSFGVLGASGRGVTEHFGVDVVDIDMICASLEYAVASTGGFCVGRSYVVDHQRLSGLGYCFSASLPPFLAVASLESLSIMENEPQRFETLKQNSTLMETELRKLSNFEVSGAAGSPIFHVRLHPKLDYAKQERRCVQELLDKIVSEARVDGFIFTTAKYLTQEERSPPDPSIRVAVNCDLKPAEIREAVSVLGEVTNRLLCLPWTPSVG